MTEDLILMERLEARENKEVLKVNACANVGIGICVSVGVNLIGLLEWLVANDSGRDVTIPVCGSCSIQ